MKKVIFMHAITPVHAGAGSSSSYVDLPIQREVTTNLPVIYASEIRGVFRAAAFEKAFGKTFESIDELEKAVNSFLKTFGGGEDVKREIENFKREKSDELDKEKKERLTYLESLTEPSKSPSSISFSDARILFFPVRSLKGVFAWVTSPYVLRRFERDMRIIDEEFKLDFPKSVEEDWAIVGEQSDIVFEQGGEKVVFEEFVLNAKQEKLNFREVFKNFLPDSVDLDFFASHAAIVGDDVFRDLTVSGAEITPRIRIDKETGTVASGSLWYEENVPAEAIFYSLVFGESDPFENLQEDMVQIGGNESIARGLFRIKIWGVERRENSEPSRG